MKRIETPITGVLSSYLVKPGDAVVIGQEVAIVESMKMMLPIVAEVAGKARTLGKKIGETIHEGETLLELE